MDKYELVADIIEHPENYSSDRLNELLSDPEIKEIYNLLCKTESALLSEKETDVDAEWDYFSQRHNIPTDNIGLSDTRHPWAVSRVASITIIICTSIVAVAAGIAVVISRTGNQDISEVTTGVPQIVLSESIGNIKESDLATPDSIKTIIDPVIFEDEPLETIMNSIASTYNVQFRFNNKEAASLHLYYKFDPALPVEEVISQLNNFEQINIRLNGQTLTID